MEIRQNFYLPGQKAKKMANIGAPGTQATRSHQSEFQAKF